MPVDMPASTSTRIFLRNPIEYAVTPKELILDEASCFFLLRNFLRQEDSSTTITFETTIDSSISTLGYEIKDVDENIDIHIPLQYTASYKLKVKIKSVDRNQIKIYLD